MENRDRKIPQATAKRLPLYFRFLKNYHEADKLRISSDELSRAVKVDPATIRRDFSYFGALGKKGYGYNVKSLLAFFRRRLDQDEVTNVILIGVGNLGTALLHYNFFESNNTRIVMAFDAHVGKVGKKVSGVPVYDIEQFNEVLPDDVTVAILTVPGVAAQSVSDLIVHSGIQGILNFTPERITVPKQIRVQHIDLVVELQTLLYFLKHYPL